MPAWAWPLLALPVVAAIGLWTYRAITAELRVRLAGALQTVLGSNVSALEQWLQAQANLAEVMASDPRVRESIDELIALARKTGGDPAALKAAPAHGGLGGSLARGVRRRGTGGFSVRDPGAWFAGPITAGGVGAGGVRGVGAPRARALAGRAFSLPATSKQRFAAEPMAFMLV